MASRIILSLWLTLYAVTVTSLAVSPTESEKSMITPGPKWDDLKKRYVYYVYYYVDYEYTTTCGYISHDIAVQNGLYGTSKAAAASALPFPVTCEGLCANSGNYLGCVDRSTQMVATTCKDYSTPTASACDYGQDCYWDLLCDSDAPYCGQNIYSGSITQFTCGFSKHDPITITGVANMTAYTAVKPNITTTASSTTNSSGSSGSDGDSVNISDTLRKIGLSLGAFIGICVGVFALCCAGCIGLCWCNRKRTSKQYGKAPYVYETTSYQPAMQSQQPLVGQTYRVREAAPQYERYEQYRHR